MRRVARQSPGTGLRSEIGEQASFRVCTRRAGGYSGGRIGRRAIDDRSHLLAWEEGEGVDKHETSKTITRQFRRLTDYHAPRTGAYQHHLLQVLVKQQLRHFLRLGSNSNTRPYQVVAFTAAVERRGIDQMAS